MKAQTCVRVAIALAFSCTCLFAQTVTSSIVGSVVDPTSQAVAIAPVTLTSTDTGAVRDATTDNLGTYRFTNVEPGTYTVTVKATGFKALTQTGIVVAAQETHNAGQMTLQLGSVSESMSVTAEAAAVQLASSEKSATVDNSDLENLTLKGRDLFGYVRLVPGVVDTANRDVTSHSAISGMNVNGGFTALNFTVDGVTDMDTGSDGSVQVEPNLDSIQEMRVLTSNYQAEFGRNSSGTITVVTKNGTRDFHGTAQWNHRHEEFNADTWVNDHTIRNGAGTAKLPYRYNIETYSIGGPVFIPKHLNKSRTHMFFFWSQERTGQFVTGGSQFVYTPTALERAGNFSQSFNNNGSLIQVLDPANGNAPFAGNVIPTSRLNPVGQELLGFFPLPNYTATLPSQVNVVNYFEQGSATHPRLNSVARGDIYISNKWNGYIRWLNDADYMYILYDGVPFSTDAGGLLGSKGIAPIIHPNGGHSESGTLTYTVSPTMVNETTFAYNWDQYTFEPTDNFATEARSLIPGLPTLFPVPSTDKQGAINGYATPTILPTFSFGGAPANAVSYSRSGASAGQEIATNPTWYYQDNLSKVIGHHSFKAGIYVEFNTKYQPSDRNYAGAFSFASNTSVPLLNTNDGFANALLGNVNSYNQYNVTTTFNVVYQNYDEYIQDNWKVNKRLTLDLGVRFSHQSPQEDNFFTFENFVPSKYSVAAQSRLYVPACSAAPPCSAGHGLVAKDPATGATVSSSYIGDLVPNSGNPATGLQVLGGPAGTNEAPYHQKALVAAPRVGYSYDLFGDGKTALRGGWGMFYNRLDGNQYYGLSGQPPIAYNVGVTTLTLAQIAAQNSGTAPTLGSLQGVTPISVQAYPASVPWDTVQSASTDLQHTFGTNMVVDVGYTLQWLYHEHIGAGCCDINYIPIGAGWPFNPNALDPTTAGSTSNGIGAYQSSSLERTIFPGYGAIEMANFGGHSTYNALTATLNKRLSHGLIFGVSYTYSKAMGTTTVTPGIPNNEEWNYGRIATDRPQNLQISYTYDLPHVSKLMHLRGVGYVLDNWQLSGITSVQSGIPYSPSCNTTSGSLGITGGYTGTPDVTQRCEVIGNPLSNMPSNGNGQVYFNAAAFALPALATGPNNSIVGPPALGNLGGGAGVFTGPRVTNFDVTLTKNIPLGNEKRVLRFQAQAYNVFNHPEFGNGTSNVINSGIQFNPTTNQVSNLSSLGYPNTTLPARIMAFSVRAEF